MLQFDLHGYHPTQVDEVLQLLVLRGIVQLIELFHFGFVERLYVHTNLE